MQVAQVRVLAEAGACMFQSGCLHDRRLLQTGRRAAGRLLLCESHSACKDSVQLLRPCSSRHSAVRRDLTARRPTTWFARLVPVVQLCAQLSVPAAAPGPC